MRPQIGPRMEPGHGKGKYKNKIISYDIYK